MVRFALISAAVTTVLLSPALVAQQPNDAQVAPDTAVAGSMNQPMQQMRQGMQEMRQGMQGMMRGMQQMQGMQEMQEMMQRMQGMMRGMQGGRREIPTCVMRDSQGGFTALLVGSVGEVGLTDVQRRELDEILGRAQEESLDVLTPDQRETLESAPPMTGMICSPVEIQRGG